MAGGAGGVCVRGGPEVGHQLPGHPAVEETAHLLELDWETRIIDSYLVLFDRVKSVLGLSFRDLTFQNFQGMAVPATALGTHLAGQ